jgi:hypothetical protein
MSASSEFPRTNDDLRAEAIGRLGVSKSALDVAWTCNKLATDTSTSRFRELEGREERRSWRGTR